MLSRDDIYSEFIRAIETLGKGNQFTMFGYLSRAEFDLIIKIATNRIVTDCEMCKLRKEQ